MPDYKPIKPKKKNSDSKYTSSTDSQLELPLKHHKINKILHLKRRITNIEDRMKFSLFFRSFFVWLTIFIAFSATIINCVYLSHVWNHLPQNIPIFSLFVNPKDKLSSKEFLWFMAFIPLVSQSFALLILYNLFRSYERLKYLILQIIIIISILSIIGIYSLVRLY